MAIAFNCPACGQPYQVPDQVAGRTTRCRQCAAEMQVPEVSVAAQAPPVEHGIQQAPATPAAFGGEAAPTPTKATDDAGPLIHKLRAVAPGVLVPVTLGALLLFFVLPSVLLARWLFGDSVGLATGHRYLPDDCKIVAVVNVEQLLASPIYQKLQKDVSELRTDAARQKLRCALVAGNFDSDEFLAVLELHAPVTLEEAKKNLRIGRTTQEQVGEVTLYRYVGPPRLGMPAAELCFCLPERYVVLQGNVGLVKHVLTRQGEPKLSTNFRKALQEMDTSASMTVLVDLEDAPFNQGPADAQQFQKIADKLALADVQLRLGEHVDIIATIHCTEGKAAEDLRDLARLGLRVDELREQWGDLVDAIQVEARGNDTIVRLRVPQARVIQGLEELMRFNF
ncbi:MAG: hypothetical protein AB7K24_17850 [Gemmataceae bacterium]